MSRDNARCDKDCKGSKAVGARVLGRSRLPPSMRCRAEAYSAQPVKVRGNVELLEGRLVAFFCSQSAPGDAVLGTYDLAVALRESSGTFIGGFQSPMEREFLTILLRGSASVVICPARGIGRMRLPALWMPPLEAGRMLVLSVFDDKVRRPTDATVTERNAFVVDLATSLLVPHADPGGKVEGLCEAALAAGKPVFTLPNRGSRLVELGATEFRMTKLPGKLTSWN